MSVKCLQPNLACTLSNTEVSAIIFTPLLSTPINEKRKYCIDKVPSDILANFYPNNIVW